MKKTSSKGFTLIELAIVIAIIGILAAVAVPRFANMTGQAERAVGQSLESALSSASAIYVAQTRKAPTQFADYVTTATVTTGAQTLSIANIVSQGYTANVAGTNLTVTFTAGRSVRIPMNGADVLPGIYTPSTGW